MQAINHQQTQEQTISSNQLTISVEFIAYLILISMALILRFASLGDVPMSEAEAIQALPAYHAINVDAPGTPQTADSVIVFWLQRISLTVFGGTEFAARLPGVIGGIVLILMPLLFRSRIGREQTFLLSVIFAFSPIAFISVRLADPTIWTIIFAIGLLWTVLNYWDEASQGNAISVGVLAAAMVFLSGISGLLLFFVLSLTATLAVMWEIYAAPAERDSTGEEILSSVVTRLSILPFVTMLVTIVAVTVIAATGFFFYPNGLNIIAESLGSALSGFVRPAEAFAPNVFALLSFIVYEPVLLVLAIISAVLMLSNDEATVSDRFAILWFGVAFLFLFIYRNTDPAFALWLVVPSAYLVSRMMSVMLVNHMPTFLSIRDYHSNNPKDYLWIKVLVALVMLAGLLMMSLYLSTLGRALLNYVGTNLSFNFEQQSVLLYARFGWFFIMGLLLIVLFFLFSSMWGSRNVVQGYSLGAFAFMLLIGMGTGWNTAVNNVSNPNELWHTSATTADAYELRETLFEVARRDSRGFPSINLTILRDEAAGIRDDGLIAWLVRDFENAKFVDSIGDVRQDEIILLPQTDSDPDLGGSYVGQSFVIHEYFSLGNMIALDWVSWFTHRKTRPYDLPTDVTILWLRLDVYDGVPALQRP